VIDGRKTTGYPAAELASLSAFRSSFDDACQTADVNDEICYDINLVTGENSTNSIQHGYEQMKPGSIILSPNCGLGRSLSE
jgi:anti-sigma regulatory factor (Ser/Thr protein kinase)